MSKELKTQRLTYKLMKAPKKDKGVNMPRFQVLKPNIIQSADTLFLPNDKGFKYLLVVVDQSRKLDAQPLRIKTAPAILNAFKAIYERKILKLPKRIEVDAGSEFKGVVKQYFEGNNVDIRVAKTGRHRQQALVERANQTIGKEIFEKQLLKELTSGKTSRLWLHLYRPILNEINNRYVRYQYTTNALCEGDSCNILGEGQKVLAIAEEPKSIEGKKLNGKFRATDVKYELKIRTIRKVLLKPGFPVLYLLDGNYGEHKVDNIGYTKNQLLPLSDAEINILMKLPINK